MEKSYLDLTLNQFLVNMFCLGKFDFSLSTIEVYNYLDQITKGFDIERARITLQRIEDIDCLVFPECLYEESRQCYLENGWEFPMKEKRDIKSGENINILDTEAMINKTHQIRRSLILYAINLLKKKLPNTDHQQITSPEANNNTVEEVNTAGRAKQQLRPEAVQEVFDILKTYFAKEERDKLRGLLETFGTTKNKLTFMGNCNKLADCFKQLIESNYILPNNKTDLSNWIVDNFKWVDKTSDIKEAKFKTVYKTISGSGQPCMDPIIYIDNGKIQKTD